MTEPTSAARPESASGPDGLQAVLARLSARVLALLELRLQLLGTELEAEKLRWLSALLALLLCLLFAVGGLLMLSLGVILLTPDAWRWAASLGLFLVFGLASWLAWRKSRSLIQAPGTLFALSLSELRRDADRLGDEHVR
ncbi:MAG: phage holin family protein [Burkholderiaceae bacterium]|nr:phage holin family protein [Roseateles sp.]MBV8469418.1 phage holin family protein [Burkholderiaceae bacterium]